LLVPAVFFIGQSLADYVLAPYLVAQRVRLNPVWVIFALFAFGYLFGFVGLLIAVPAAAAVGVLTRFATILCEPILRTGVIHLEAGKFRLRTACGRRTPFH
jgi:predicted PurR-regulated permease PerM